MTPAVSVIVPVHGRAGLTQRCLDMVLGELPPDAELVVVDDASPDGTPELLAGYGNAIRSLRLEENVGFARACNEGAALADGELLVFLNNDVEPMPGWLAALRRHAEERPEATVVGAKLLYPNGTVQHAGVVFGQDGYPHHLYAGFPTDHPAVSRSRPLQAVTGACLLVRHAAFEAVGGFDPGYLNSLEDVDLCLRLGEAGGEVHYCHRAVLVHLESASRGRSDRFERSVALYRERWRERVRRDDLDVYVADGLLGVEYHDSYPTRLAVDPLLAVVDRGREEEIEHLLEAHARQSSDLLQEVVRLTATAVGERPQGKEVPHRSERDGFDAAAFLVRVREIEAGINRLQAEVAAETGVDPGPRLGYAHLVEGVRSAIDQRVPPNAAVLVISRGDRELVRLRDHRGQHFPQDRDGGYAGYHPASSEQAIAELERLRESGAEFLVFPPTAAWWLQHYKDFGAYLDDRYARHSAELCEIYDLRSQLSSRPIPNTMPA